MTLAYSVIDLLRMSLFGRNIAFRHAIRNIAFLLFATIASMAEVTTVSPESLDTELSKSVSDSTLFVRAQLAYSRGLYQNAFDLADRIESPSDRVFLIQGECSHILAKPHTARGYFAKIRDPDLLPLAQLGLAEIYCYEVHDPDSCKKYRKIVEEMGYLSRFVDLSQPVEATPTDTSFTPSETPEGWTLQFGAFKMHSLAEQMAVKVRAEGLTPFIVPMERDSEKLFYVYGGQFTTKGEAAARADALAGEMVAKVVELPDK